MLHCSEEKGAWINTGAALPFDANGVRNGCLLPPCKCGSQHGSVLSSLRAPPCLSALSCCDINICRTSWLRLLTRLLAQLLPLVFCFWRAVILTSPPPPPPPTPLSLSLSSTTSLVVSWKVLPGILQKHCCILPDRNTGKGQTDVPSPLNTAVTHTQR